VSSVIPFPRRPSPPALPPELDLVITDAELAGQEELYTLLRSRLKGTRGAARSRLQFQLDECAREIVGLEQRRLRLAGAELALLRGGKYDACKAARGRR